MPYFEIAVTDYRWGRFSTDNLPPIIGGGRTDNAPIMPDNTQWVKRLQASNHKAFIHYRRQSFTPIMTDKSKISVAAGAYKAPPPIMAIKTACAGGL